MKLTAGFVYGGHKPGVIVEGCEHESVVFSVDLEDGAHIDLWIIESLVTELLDGGQTLVGDVILQQVSQLSKTVRDAGNELEERRLRLFVVM